MKTILVIANETLAGAPLLERARHEAQEGPVRVVLCVPRKNPTHGAITYADSVFDAARIRVDLARGVLREMGIDCIGEVGDSDPYTAAMDAIAEHEPDLILVSTLPPTTSTWLQGNVVERIDDAVPVPVEHITVDPSEGSPFDVSLVIANRTTSSDALIGELKALADRESPGRERLFIFVVPAEGGDGRDRQQARARLDQVIDRARAADLLAAGMVGDPDPYTAAMNALAYFEVDDIVVSTYPSTRSGWLRADLVERVRGASGLPVDHVVTEPAKSPAA
ncbi:MAG: hypothetical protein ACKOB9_08400 [Solirubrobacterales bacterium]